MPWVQRPRPGIPSYETNFAGPDRLPPANPGLWQGLEGAWQQSLGVTGELRDIVRDNHGVATGGPTWEMDQLGYCHEFDGATQYITTVEFPIHTWTGLTCSCWIKPTAANDDFAFGQFNDNFKAGFRVGYNDFVKRISFTFKSAAAVSVNSLNNSVQLDEWTYIAVRWDGSNIKIFINGNEHVSAAAGAIDPDPTLLPFQIGSDGGNLDPWNGRLSNCGLWSRALSPNEIQQLFVDPHAIPRPMQRLFVGGGAAAANIVVLRRRMEAA